MSLGYYDGMGGCGLGSAPCANCESEPQSYGIFCSRECWDEHNGTHCSNCDAEILDCDCGNTARCTCGGEHK